MVKEDSLGTGVTVLILVAYDCDALCACHIITVLFSKKLYWQEQACLKLEWVKYSVMGVASYDHLDSIYRREMKANPDVCILATITCNFSFCFALFGFSLFWSSDPCLVQIGVLD